uniref:Uncharacterized protein n=1 Tax=Oryza sativa subsp. japonica TaxID=39947 RepID=Q6ZKR8_ORYSJ|nr:hypothetical protein [Oryza sativa Japonica Group]
MGMTAAAAGTRALDQPEINRLPQHETGDFRDARTPAEVQGALDLVAAAAAAAEEEEGFLSPPHPANMWEEARLCEEKGKRQRCARRCSGHRRRQENDEAAVLVKREHPGRAVAADAARREHLDRTAASDSVAAACHLWSAFDLMTRRKDPLDGLKLYSGDEHYWFDLCDLSCNNRSSINLLEYFRRTHEPSQRRKRQANTKRELLRHQRRSGCTGRSKETNGRDRSYPKRTAEIERSTTGPRQTATMTSAATSPPAAARERKLAGERRREDANGGHQDMNGRRRRRGKGGGVLRLDDDGDVPAVNSDGEGADEDGGATATTMATSPSDGDDWSDGKTRLERR